MCDTLRSYMLNIGCGAVHHPAWTNVDVSYQKDIPNLIVADVRDGLPIPDCSFEAVYTSHLLEHLPGTAAHFFVRECYRVLKPGGILRVVVPDLEGIAREYLRQLEALVAGDDAAEANYDWMLLELYDQTVRDKSGGGMADYLRQSGLSNKEFILSRIGSEAEGFWKKTSADTSLLGRLKNPRGVGRAFRRTVAKGVVWLVGGKMYARAFGEGLFRAGGEVHRWMYDRYSLSRLLGNADFTEIEQRDATSSRIANFETYDLDTANGRIRKPDSLFMEARRPESHSI